MPSPRRASQILKGKKATKTQDHESHGQTCGQKEKVMSKLLLEMGDHCVSNFIKNDSEGLGREKYSLDLYQDNRFGAVRLHGVAPADTMWGQYWYRSGINASMTKELQGIVAEVTNEDARDNFKKSCDSIVDYKDLRFQSSIILFLVFFYLKAGGAGL